MANCSSCNAEIDWLKTESGKKIPVNPEMVLIELHTGKKPDTCIVTPGGKVIWGVGRPLDYDTSLGEFMVGYTSHFATCPAAARHRLG